MADLFDPVAPNETDAELADWINSLEPDDPTPEAEARRLGQDLAACPSWSQASAKAIQGRLDNLFRATPPELHHGILTAFRAAEEAERTRRKAAKADSPE